MPIQNPYQEALDALKQRTLGIRAQVPNSSLLDEEDTMQPGLGPDSAMRPKDPEVVRTTLLSGMNRELEDRAYHAQMAGSYGDATAQKGGAQEAAALQGLIKGNERELAEMPHNQDQALLDEWNTANVKARMSGFQPSGGGELSPAAMAANWGRQFETEKMQAPFKNEIALQELKNAASEKSNEAEIEKANIAADASMANQDTYVKMLGDQKFAAPAGQQVSGWGVSKNGVNVQYRPDQGWNGQLLDKIRVAREKLANSSGGLLGGGDENLMMAYKQAINAFMASVPTSGGMHDGIRQAAAQILVNPAYQGKTLEQIIAGRGFSSEETEALRRLLTAVSGNPY